MIGASREALAAGRDNLESLTDNTSVDAAKLAEELAAVTVLLDREVSLRRVLTDPARSGQDKAALVRWIFASTAQHPAVAELAQVTPEQRTEMSKAVAGLFERLLTQDCRAPFRDARKNEGQETVSAGFGVLVQTAMRGLIENATVSSALASVDAHLDKQKIAAAMADSP